MFTRVDDRLHDHPKFLKCSLSARGLWFCRRRSRVARNMQSERPGTVDHRAVLGGG